MIQLFNENLALQEYKAIDITEEKYASNRKNQALYAFNQNNPFDESTNWTELNKHYKNGTLDYDYNISYSPVVKYLKATNPKFDVNSDEMSSEKSTIREDSVGDILEEIYLGIKKEECNDKPAIVSETFRMKLAKFEFPKFNAKLTEVPALKLPTIPKLKNTPLNPFYSYKKTFYLTTAVTALISTGALVGTATMFPPLIPIVITYLLPISVVSSGIILFKVKRMIKKRKSKISLKVLKFRIKPSSRPFNSLFRPLKL